MDVKSTTPDDLQNKLLTKYQYIITNEGLELFSIEDIISQIVNYYEDIIGCMPGNVYWFDKNLIAVGCNKNVLNMFGFKSLDEFKGLTFDEMGKIGNWTSEAEASFKADTLEVLKTGKLKLGIEEPPIPHSNGKMIYFLSSRVPVFDRKNNVIGVIGISIDITDRKEMELELIDAKEKAEAAAIAKSEFMENMSHDFKTPLNGIYGVVQLLSMRDDLPEDLKYLVAAQEKSVLRLKRLIDSILDLDKVHVGKIELQNEELNLLEIIESIVDNLSYQIRNKDVNIIINYPTEVPRYLIGDTHCVTSILLNLLSNAVKFTDKGNVAITVKLIWQQDEHVSLQISVEDTGSGIPGNKITQIFDRFQRLGLSNTGLIEGHGIGLAVVKELVDKLSGNISVESQLEKGSIFTLTLPFKLQDMRIFISEWQKKHPGIRILLVSDKKTSTDILLDQLGKEKISKAESKNVINELLSAAQCDEHYHILIIDNEIEYIDAIQLIKIIHSISLIPKVMAIISTPSQNKEWFDTARDAGYFDFIMKPILPSELDHKITEAWDKWLKK